MINPVESGNSLEPKAIPCLDGLRYISYDNNHPYRLIFTFHWFYLNPGTLSGTSSSTCKTPIAIFLSHGIDDQILNYSGGLTIFNVFSKLNGCTAMHGARGIGLTALDGVRALNSVAFMASALAICLCSLRMGASQPPRR